MSKKSKKSLMRRGDARPFDPAMLRRARKIVEGYRLILEENEQLGYVGSAIELPTVFADGKTPDECVKETRQALAVAVATMIEQGQRPPSPAARGMREMQINIRLTAEEKLHLQEAARRFGFKGISDFVRIAALDRSAVAK